MRTTVLSGPERRRRWTSEQKLKIVEETLVDGSSVVAVARRHDIHPNLIYGWRRQLGNGGSAQALSTRARFVPVTVAQTSAASRKSKAAAFEIEPVIEVMLRNGRALRVPDGVSPARAVALADALEGIAR